MNIKADLAFNVYPAVVEGVCGAVTYGWRRAYKHSDREPDEEERERVCAAIEQAVLNWFCETFSWPGPGTE